MALTSQRVRADRAREEGRGPRRQRRKPVKTSTIWLHRWLSLVIGTLLVVVTTSGAILVYEPEINRWDEGNHLRAATPGLRSGEPAVTLPDAVERVASYDADFEPSTVHYSDDTIQAEDYESGRRVTLDRQTGEVLGDFNVYELDGVVSWTMRLNDNIHLCMLSARSAPATRHGWSQRFPAAAGSASATRRSPGAACF